MARPRPVDGTTIVRLAMQWRQCERVERLTGRMHLPSTANALHSLQAALDTRPEVTGERETQW